MAPLQKGALYSLAIGLVLAVALVVVFVSRGDITAFDEDLGFRLTVYALWIGVPLAYLVAMKLTVRRPGRLDERDRLIAARAAKTQLFAVILSLIIWTITLTEVYWDQGQVPVVFLTVVFISTLVVMTLAQSVGILIGYRGTGQGD